MFDKLKQLLDWVYRKKCYVCKKDISQNSICEDCFNKIHINYNSTSIKTLKNINVHCASTYIDNLLKLIRGLKYHNKKDFAVPIAQVLYKYWQNQELSKNDFEIVPVPLYKKREKKRNYNHMFLIAQEFSKLTGYSVNTDIIKRIKDTKPQYKLSRNERIQNLKNAFVVNKKEYNNKKLLIIDDICTSGTTINEIVCAFNKEDIHNLTGLVCSVPKSQFTY